MREPKGFYVPFPSITRFRSQSQTNRGISFQLKTDGVRYFFVMTETPSQKQREVRDISTQFRAMSRYGGMWVGEEETKKVQERLFAHARAFYPEFVIPEKHAGASAAMPVGCLPWVAFPMLGMAMRKSGFHAPVGVNLQVASGLRAFTVQEMTARIFGESPRQLQAAVAESLVKGSNFINIDNLTLASLLRGYLPPNSLAEILRMKLHERNMIQQVDKHSANHVRLLLRRFNTQRLMRLVQSVVEIPHGEMLLRDSANQYADARKHHPDTVMDLNKQFRSVQELHESVTREYRKLKNVNQEVHHSDDLVESLSSIELPDGAQLIWPGCTHDLMNWANEMNNCIYSYGKDAAAGRSLLLAVLDRSGKMIINIMVRGKNVIQCYGNSNQNVTDDVLLEALFKGLIDADIVSPENDHSDWTRRRMW